MKTQRNGGGSGSPVIRHEERYPIVRFTDLHTDSTSKDITELLRGVCRIRKIDMFHDVKGNFLGEAEVWIMQGEAELEYVHNAVRELNNKDFKGKPLNAAFIELSVIYCDSSDEEEDDLDSEKATKQPRCN